MQLTYNIFLKKKLIDTYFLFLRIEIHVERMKTILMDGIQKHILHCMQYSKNY